MYNVLEVLRGAAAYLDKKGVESARLNAELLLAQVLGVSRMELYLQFDRPLSEAERDSLRGLIRSRGEGIPVQHLLGSIEFCGREFVCDARALIPRQETEQFVEFLLERCQEGDTEIMIDVGTGSGVIAVSLALERPSWKIAASDSSGDALELARHNADNLGAAVDFHEVDLLPAAGDRYSLIAANLPYIPAAEVETLSREVQHDPRAALDGGSEGTEVIRRLIVSSKAHLQPGGLLALEIGCGQEGALKEFLKEHNYRDIESVCDYQGVIRFLFARYG